MNITEKQEDFIKMHQGMLKVLISDRIQDYFNLVVDEPDPHRKEVLSLMVKELRMTLTTIENITKLKKEKKDGEPYTGV